MAHPIKLPKMKSDAAAKNRVRLSVLPGTILISKKSFCLSILITPPSIVFLQQFYAAWRAIIPQFISFDISSARSVQATIAL